MATHDPHAHGHHAGDHVHGSMDIRAHEQVFGGFIKWVTWVTILSLGVAVFLALTNA